MERRAGEETAPPSSSSRIGQRRPLTAQPLLQTAHRQRPRFQQPATCRPWTRALLLITVSLTCRAPAAAAAVTLCHPPAHQTAALCPFTSTPSLHSHGVGEQGHSHPRHSRTVAVCRPPFPSPSSPCLTTSSHRCTQWQTWSEQRSDADLGPAPHGQLLRLPAPLHSLISPAVSSACMLPCCAVVSSLSRSPASTPSQRR